MNPSTNNKMVFSQLNNLIPRSILMKQPINDVKVVHQILNTVRNNPQLDNVDTEVLIPEIIYFILRHSKNNVSVSLYLISGLQSPSLSDLNLPDNLLVDKLLNESNETKRNDKANDVLSKIMQKMPLDLKERTPPHIKGKISVVLLNAEQFFNTNKNVSLSEQYKRMRNQLNSQQRDRIRRGVPSTYGDEQPPLYYSQMRNRANPTARPAARPAARQVVRPAARPAARQADTTNNNKYYKKEVTLELGETLNNADITSGADAEEKIIYGTYIDTEPDIMTGVDGKLYIYDKHSGTLQDLPDKNDMKKVTPEEVEELLKKHELTRNNLSNALKKSMLMKKKAEEDDILTEEESELLEKSVKTDTNIINYVVLAIVLLLVVLLVGFIIYYLMTN